MSIPRCQSIYYSRRSSSSFGIVTCAPGSQAKAYRPTTFTAILVRTTFYIPCRAGVVYTAEDIVINMKKKEALHGQSSAAPVPDGAAIQKEGLAANTTNKNYTVKCIKRDPSNQELVLLLNHAAVVLQQSIDTNPSICRSFWHVASPS